MPSKHHRHKQPTVILSRSDDVLSFTSRSTERAHHAAKNLSAVLVSSAALAWFSAFRCTIPRDVTSRVAASDQCGSATKSQLTIMRFTGLEEIFGLPNNAEGQNKRRCMKLFLIAAGLVLACAGCSGGSQWRAYVARITAERVAKDATFKTQSEPIPTDLKDRLLPLVYYSPDARYDVLAVLKPSSDAKALQMVYSDGAIRDVRRVGTLEFILRKKRRQSGFILQHSSKSLPPT